MGSGTTEHGVEAKKGSSTFPGELEIGMVNLSIATRSKKGLATSTLATRKLRQHGLVPLGLIEWPIESPWDPMAGLQRDRILWTPKAFPFPQV